MELRVFSTFSGIGMQERGIQQCKNIKYINAGTCEVDKDAMLSFAAIHNNLTKEKIISFIEKYKDILTEDKYKQMAHELLNKKIGYDFIKNKQYDWIKLANRKDKTLITKYWLAMKLNKNVGDISSVKEIPLCDLLTFSFPCQDISVAGKQKGIEKGKTRSGLVYEVIRLLNSAKEKNTLPKFLIMENVKNLVGNKFIDKFQYLNKEFEEIGYNVYWKVLNAQECGIPQKRKRVFGVYIRKDIDTKNFYFPEPFDSGIRLKNILQKEVDNKYYLSKKIQERFILTDKTFTKDVIGTTKPSFRTIGQRDVVYNINGTIGTLTATDRAQPKQILLKENTPIRRLTPIEYFRLMGLTKKDALACYDVGESDCSLYKQAGNGLVTNCITLLIEHLYKAQINSDFICTDEKILKNIDK